MSEKKRIILIGRTSAGKTTLCQYLNHQALEYRKTQMIEIVNKQMIDTPGEFLEQRGFRGALLVTSTDADVIVMVQDATEDGTMFPPAFSTMFAKPCIGVVTKSDLVDDEQIRQAKARLDMAGARKVFVTSSYQGTGFEELLQYLGYQDDASQAGGTDEKPTAEEMLST